MPFGLANHCLVKVKNDSIVFAIGGRIGHDTFGHISDSTFFYMESTEGWTVGPKMSVPREAHACGSTIDPSTGAFHVVVSGGFATDMTSGKGLQTTELWTLTDNVENLRNVLWTPGPRLPVPSTYGRMVSVSFGSRLLLLGGIDGDSSYSGSIFEWTCSKIINDGNDGCQFKILRQRLFEPRSGFVAMEAFVPCIRVLFEIESDDAISMEDNCDNETYSYMQPYFQDLTRKLCCHGGNLCVAGHGSCSRDSDCLGDLVCGCHNCDFSLGTVFGMDDNCCTETKESCFVEGCQPIICNFNIFLHFCYSRSTQSLIKGSVLSFSTWVFARPVVLSRLSKVWSDCNLTDKSAQALFVCFSKDQLTFTWMVSPHVVPKGRFLTIAVTTPHRCQCH